MSNPTIPMCPASLAKLFGDLKLETTGTSRQRVIKLVIINGWTEIAEKEIVKQIIRAIEPRSMREIVKDDIVVRGKANFQTKTSLFLNLHKAQSNTAEYNSSRVARDSCGVP